MKLSPSVRGLMRRPTFERRPYPDAFSPSERAVIEVALVQGILALKDAKALDFKTCSEVEINSALELLLNRMLDSDPPVLAGFSKAFFQTVVRGAELNNHDGSLPEKRPDLAFRSTRTQPLLVFPEQCVLLVECKIVDHAHPMKLYGRNGIQRFVDGTYSWAVSSAMMLGYSRDDYHPTVQLHKHLVGYGRNYNLVEPLKRRDAGVTDPELYISIHDRRTVTGIPPTPDGRIILHHLWLKVD